MTTLPNASGEVTEQQQTPTPVVDDNAAQVDVNVPDSPEFNAAWDAAFGPDKESQPSTDKGDATGDTIAGATANDATADEGDKGKAEAGAVQPDANKTGDADKAVQEALATLPRSLRSAAERAGYTDAQLAEDIADFGADRVSASLERLHGGFNDLSTRYAQLGRAGQPVTPAAQPAPQNQQQSAAVIDALLEPKNLADFESEYGKGIVDKLIKPLLAELAPMREIVARSQVQEQKALQAEINTVFAGLGDEYLPLYGKGGHDQIAGESRDHRAAVLRDADLILAGAERAGVAMSNREAIERAHNLYVAPRRAEFERKKLAAAVQKRNGAITARPSQRRAPATVGDGAKKSDQSAINALGRREAELGVSFFED